MNPAQELREVVTQLKNILNADREMGFDPPSLPSSALLETKKEKRQSGTLHELREFIGECKRCNLSLERKKLVFGEGNPDARLVFVGEGPGRDEDHEGRPFVGEAGKLLTRIIEKGMGINRDDIYICNVVKCRPPKNRDPEKVEITTCLPFLKQQIKIIKPEVICCLGRIAGRELTGPEFKITRDRGKWYSFMGIPLIATFHPAYILRNPSKERHLKAQVWEDIQKVMERLGLGSR